MRIGYGTSVTVPAQAERWFSELRAGRAFLKNAGLAASVGNFSEIQLFNPVASGKQCLIYRLISSLGTADGMVLRTFNTALATLVGTGANLSFGGAAAVGEIRTAQPAAADGTIIGNVQATVNTPWERISVWGGELSPGQGLIIASGSVNENLVAEFWWNEV